MAFVRDKKEQVVEIVPYFEDIAREKGVVGRGVTKPIEFYKERIRKLLFKLDAAEIVFVAGKIEVANTIADYRYAFQIEFRYKGNKGLMTVAALPLRTKSWHQFYEQKKDRAIAMSLYWQGNQLEAELDSKMYRPGVSPLVPYLQVDGGMTVTEIVVGGLMDKLPRFSTDRPSFAATSSANGKSDEVVDGEFTEAT